MKLLYTKLSSDRATDITIHICDEYRVENGDLFWKYKGFEFQAFSTEIIKLEDVVNVG